MKPREIPGAVSGCLLLTFLLSLVTASGQTGAANSWTKAASGNWDDASAWSLGVLPNSSQSVLITNSGWKAVAINPSTPINFPASMTVDSLTIRGAWDTFNTLLLNHAGNAVPLTVLNGLEVADSARILNFHSGLVVQGGTIVVTNAQIIQDGGLVRTTNAPMYLRKAEYHLTNGVFEAGDVWIGTPVPGHFYQYGGKAVIAHLRLTTYSPGARNGYSLYGGTLELPGGLYVLGNYFQGWATYFQAGGTNRTPRVLIGQGPSSEFILNGGLLGAGDVEVRGDYYASATLEQNGGTHIITNTLNLIGDARNIGTPRPATYHLRDGTLSARLINLEAGRGDALFVQSNGVAQAEQIQGNGAYIWDSSLALAGGALSCANLSWVDGGYIFQNGGVLVVSNSLNLAGYRESPGIKVYSRYDFVGGALTASNINVGGWWAIHDSAVPNRISNPGSCSLSHGLWIGNAVEQLGRFILVSNAIIDLAGTASRLSFANSSGQAWNSAATLVVTNWNGNPSGSGAEQLKFGTSQSGLTSTQLSQIRFANPAGMPTGTYPARILATGEVVPAPRPRITMTRSSNGMSISWTGNYQLLTSTNVHGPYTVITGATSPHPISFSDPQRFFYLRSP